MAHTGHIIEVPFQRCLRILALLPHIPSWSPRRLIFCGCCQRKSRQCSVAEPLVSLEFYRAVPSERFKTAGKAHTLDIEPALKRTLDEEDTNRVEDLGSNSQLAVQPSSPIELARTVYVSVPSRKNSTGKNMRGWPAI